MPSTLRSPSQPRGLSSLSPSDFEKVKDANLLADRVAVLTRLMIQRGGIVIEENPKTSHIWQLPSRQELLSRNDVEEQIVDLCAFGAPHRARTRLLCVNLGAPSWPNCACFGRGVCDFTKEAHQQLRGKAGSQCATKQKSALPLGLCRCLAKFLVSRKVTGIATERWKRMKGD